MPIRVLIADDHALMREGTRSMLEVNGDIVVVGQAADGLEAVALVEVVRPDVVLMDIAMPNLNGVAATREIKRRRPATAVLVLTAYDDDEYVFALLEAGAAGYLMKSVRGEDLINAIHAVHGGESVLSPQVARKVLTHFRRADAAGSAAHRNTLTPREREVLLLAARGLPNKAIAEALGLSIRTVQLHLAHLFEKMDVASRTEAVVGGLKRGWLSLEDIG